MYARPPHVPPAVTERFVEPINLDDPALAANLVAERAAWVLKHAPAAGNNLAIAQHRDKLMYARRRSGGYLPNSRILAVGDYAYHQRARDDTLDPKVAREVYRITQLLGTGVAVLMGRCGRTMKAHISTLAPCHLPMDGVVDHTLARPPPEQPCIVCNEMGDWGRMLLCDGCGKGYHLYCLKPPLEEVPEVEVWVCTGCASEGITNAQVRQRQRHVADILREPPTSKVQEDQGGSGAVKDHEQLHGRIVCRPKGRGRPIPQWGTVSYNESKPRGRCFDIHFVGGSTMHELSAAHVHKWLQPVGTALPSHVSASAVESLPAVTDQLVTASDWLVALRTRMPGVWSLKHATQMMTAWQQDQRLRPSSDTPPLEPLLRHGAVQSLFITPRLGQGLVLNPFYQHINMPKHLHVEPYEPMRVLSTDLAPTRGAFHFVNPLSASSLAETVKKAKIGAIITFAPSFVLDMFLPVATTLGVLVAVFTSADYLTAAPHARTTWLSQFKHTQRMHCVWLADNTCWLILLPSTTAGRSGQP